MDFRAPRQAGLTLVSLLGILAFTAVAVPMGDAPGPAGNESLPGTEVTTMHGRMTTLRNVNRVDDISLPLSEIVSNSSSQTTMTFNLDRPIRSEEVKVKLLDAGVKIPPMVLFYKDNGILLARGTKEQLALVNRVVLKLNGFSLGAIAERQQELHAKHRCIFNR